jgi:hypothetical protein
MRLDAETGRARPVPPVVIGNRFQQAITMGVSHWQREGRRLVDSLVNRCGGVATPHDAVTVDEWAASAGPDEGFRLRSQVAWQLPGGRSVAGDLAAAEAVAAEIDNPIGQARYRQHLWGPSSRSHETFVVSLAGGRVAHGTGLVVTADNRVLTGGSGIAVSCPHPTNPLRLSHLPRPRPLAGSLAVLTSFAGKNYYHWFASGLARLRLYEEAGVARDASWYVAVNAAFQRESLRLLGIAPERIVPATPRRHLRPERLLVSSWRDQQLAPEDCDFLHRRLTRHLAADRPADRRLFIMRTRPGRRSIVNQSDLMRALAPLGFEPVRLERLPLAEQIGLFHRAECVVGSHGAGLTNLLFCRPGAVAVEIATPCRVLPCFAEIAHHRHLYHHLELARPVNRRHFDPATGIGDSDLLVDAAAIRDRVAHLLAERRPARRTAA